MKNFKLKFILIIITGFFYPVASFANNSLNEWKPQIVEKMYLLPPKHLNKVLNNDFNKSILALNLQTTDNKIKDRIEKISELNSMLKGASRNEKLEIKHQIIINKRDYIKDMSNLLTMKRQKLDTKKSFFQKIQKNIRSTSLNRKSNSEFLKDKNNALKRAESIDFKILDSTSHSLSKTSKYFKQYQINKDAVKKLKLAIEKHPMSNKNILSKDPKNKIEAVKNYVHNIDTEISVLEMKEEMINYMAKIVALDAMSLAEEVAFDAQNQNEIVSTNFNDPVNVISVFTN
tara:strand:- start:11 stop:874 length:864 start_codon:yes stop_codon:yes gene_type:complete